jgi:DNA helicase-2/ATP-dependent DNA helicase PcrA
MSYNVAAVRDLKMRFAAIFGNTVQGTPEFRTIHGFCAKVLEAYSHMTGRPLFRLMEKEGASAALLRRLYRAITNSYPTETEMQELTNILTNARNRMIEGDAMHRLTLNGMDLHSLFEAYRQEKIRLRIMDYDDQLVFAYRALRAHPQLLAHFQQKYPHIQVDEAQDVSLLQHRIVQLIAGNAQSLLMVGDEDQSIYAFRAAHPKGLLDFRSTYPDGQVLTLERNYRSVGSIIDGANRLIRFNRDRYDKKMFSCHPEGDPIRLVALPARRVQFRWLFRAAAEAQTQTAFLFRNNDTALPLIDLLTAANVPFYCRERDDGYLSHPHIASLCDGLRLVHAPHNADIFARIFYRFDIPVPRAALDAALQAHRPDGALTPMDLLIRQEQCSEGAISRLRTLQRILERAARMQTRDALELLRSETGLGRGIDRLRLNVTHFDTLMVLADLHPDPADFFRRLEELRTLRAQGIGTPDARVVLSTIHSAKGLEFDHVIAVDFADGILPASPDSDDPAACHAHSEEERRLCYVGITRAKHRLTILTYKNTPSRFVDELTGRVQPGHVPPETVVQRLRPKDFTPGCRVRHRTFGPGVVTACTSSVVTVRFHDQYGERRLDLALCRTAHLLTEEADPLA